MNYSIYSYFQKQLENPKILKRSLGNVYAEIFILASFLKKKTPLVYNLFEH